MNEELRNTVSEDLKAVDEGRFSMYGLVDRMNRIDGYEAALRDHYLDQHKTSNIPFPGDVYVDNKIVQLKKEVEELPDQEQDRQKAISDSYEKDQSEQDEKAAKVAEKEFRDFEKAADIFLDKQQQNERLYLDHTEFLVEYLADHPKEFQKYSERYFSEGELRNPLPQLKNLKSLNQKTRFFRKHVINTASKLSQKSEQLGIQSRIGKSLKNYHQREFVNEREEVKKSLAQAQTERKNMSAKNQMKL